MSSLGEDDLLLIGYRCSEHKSQLVDSQQLFKKSFINQDPSIMNINDGSTQNYSLTKNPVNEENEHKKSVQAAESDSSKIFINPEPVIMKKKSGSAEAARMMIEEGLM